MFEDANIASILREWGKQATPEELAELTRWRDQRLAALAAHKKSSRDRYGALTLRSSPQHFAEVSVSKGEGGH